MNELLDKYFNIFPNDSLVMEWEDITDNDKIKILTEAIEKKITVVETELYKNKYMEGVFKDAE